MNPMQNRKKKSTKNWITNPERGFFWIMSFINQFEFLINFIEFDKLPFSHTLVQVVRVFTNGPEDLGSILGHVIPKALKMVLDPAI